MDSRLLFIAAGLMAVAGVLMLFAVDSPAVGLLFIVAGLLFAVTAANANRKK